MYVFINPLGRSRHRSQYGYVLNWRAMKTVFYEEDHPDDLV